MHPSLRIILQLQPDHITIHPTEHPEHGSVTVVRITLGSNFEEFTRPLVESGGLVLTTPGECCGLIGNPSQSDIPNLRLTAWYNGTNIMIRLPQLTTPEFKISSDVPEKRGRLKVTIDYVFGNIRVVNDTPAPAPTP